MNEDTYKRQMCEYLSYIFRTCGVKPPTDIKLSVLTSSCDRLAEYNTILGMDVYVVNYIPEDFYLTILAEEENGRKFLKAFSERQREVDFREDCSYD